MGVCDMSKMLNLIDYGFLDREIHLLEMVAENAFSDCI